MTTYLVPVDGTDASYRALGIACDAARREGALVSSLYVIEVPRLLPVDADMVSEVEQAESVLSRAEAVAQEHRSAFRCGVFQARDAGSVIVDEAEEQRADAIVLGLTYHRPYGRFELGRRAQYVLANAPCEVWLVRTPPAPGDLPRPAPGVVGHIGQASPAED